MDSIWYEPKKLQTFKPLQEDIETDVLVIGGGIAGLLCAHLLTEAGVDCTVAEAAEICSGITKNTTAKITAQHGLIYSKIKKEFDTKTARLYLQANLDAIEKYQALCRGMDCDFEKQDNYIYLRQNRKALIQELDILKSIGYSAELCETPELPFATAGAVRFQNQAQFHPVQFLSQLARGLKIYENTTVRQIDGLTAYTDGGTISAKAIIVATHFPFINRHGFYFVKQYQQRSYVLALKGAKPISGMYLDGEANGLSFRMYKDLLLIGGGGHRTGKAGGGWSELEAFAARHYPQASIEKRWAAQDCMTLDGIPYIGLYSENTPNLYVISGFNKWGMTTAMAGAQLLTDLITGKESPYARLFASDRRIWRKQLAINLLETASNLLTVSGKRCPHLGCALSWNPQEHSWDCPCHGSRFTQDGVLLDNPAVKNMKTGRQE